MNFIVPNNHIVITFICIRHDFAIDSVTNNSTAEQAPLNVFIVVFAMQLSFKNLFLNNI